MPKKKDWFKLKRYPHLDKQIKERDRVRFEGYIKNPDKISKHSFLPFIHKTKKVRKFRKEYSDADGSVIETNGKALRKSGSKLRELYYASHLDSLIYSYYSKLLSDRYEEKIKLNGLDDVVLAYRSISKNIDNPKGSNKCNIDFANDVFRYISNYPSDHFVAITFDIRGFFDELNHKILNQLWCDLLGTEKMGKDHFNVFKSLTRFSFVDIVDLFMLFQNKIIVQDPDSQGKLRESRNKRVSKIKFLKKENAIAFCSKKDFLRNKSKLVRNKKYIKNDKGELALRDFGIPQGTPISSVLANAYMINFDIELNSFLKSKNGIYRRYSDDMIIVCPLVDTQDVINEFHEQIKAVKLKIQDSKTQKFHFLRDGEDLNCAQEFKNGLLNQNKQLSYLGFNFDGNFTYLKPGGLSGYYRKMKRAVARSKKFSKAPGSNEGEVFKRRILDKHSYKGSFRKRTWLYSEKKKGFVKSEKFNLGNYLTYSRKAEGIMMNNKIRSQTKKHWFKLNKELKK